MSFASHLSLQDTFLSGTTVAEIQPFTAVFSPSGLFFSMKRMEMAPFHALPGQGTAL